MAIEVEELVGVRKLTFDDVLEMVDAGIIDRDEQVELVDGVLIALSPESTDHAGITAWLTRLATQVYAHPLEVRVNTTMPLIDRYNFRQPDVHVTRPLGTERFGEANETILAIEVAKSSIRTDLGPKARQYATWGVQHYWVVDLAAQAVIVHSHPAAEGYGRVARHVGDDTVSVPETGVVMSVARLLNVPRS